ncbi:hypothetical protein T484DRAFT_2159182 [Baffinella frigidus]|nr:hypothetical protein T484DRAFT_2159182 [Cryptophyta sp. CCMP2293]
MPCGCSACTFRVAEPRTDCRFGSQCSKRDCKFAHPSPAVSARTKHMAGSVACLCHHGIKCHNSGCDYAHPSPALKCRNDEGGLSESFSAMSVASRSSGGSGAAQGVARVQQSLGVNFCQMYGVQRAFMENLERALADRRKKCIVLLVDLDNVPKFWQEKSVEKIATMPYPVFVFGSANKGCSIRSRGNFNFTLALRSKDAADAVLNMVAASLQSLLVAHGRVGDVAVVPISDDRIFEQTAATLQQGGSPSRTMSRSDAARGLFPKGLMAPPPRQQIAPASSSDAYWWCGECRKTFTTEKACDRHQADTGHTDGSGSESEDDSSEGDYWECGECKKTFSTEKGWAQHQSSTGHTDHICSCGRTFASQRSLEQHERHHGI